MNKSVARSVERNGAFARRKFVFIVFCGVVLLGLSLYAGTPIKIAAFLFAMAAVGGTMLFQNVVHKSKAVGCVNEDIGDAIKKPNTQLPMRSNVEVTADKFMFKQLSDMGMSPSKDGSTIIFQYKGGVFRAQWLDKHIIRISFPCILSVDAAHQSQISRLLNVINSSYVLVKTIMVPSDNDSSLLIHAVGDIYYTSLNCSTPGYLTEVLDMFFTVRNTLFEGIGSLEEHEELACNQDDNYYYGFSVN